MDKTQLQISNNIEKFMTDITLNKLKLDKEKEKNIASISKIIDDLKKDINQTKPVLIEHIDEHIILDNLFMQDINKLRESPQKLQKYYKQNIKALILYLQEVSLKLDKIQKPKLIEYRLEIIRDLLLQYIQFKHYYEFIANDINYKVSSGITMKEHDVFRHLKLSAMLMNNCCFSPRELIPATVTEIRQLIETKIRYSFNLDFALIDKDNNLSILPIPMNIFFTFIKENNNIDFNESILIKKIYDWSNYYIHTGQFNYYWQIWFATRKLNGFAKNCKEVNGKYISDTPIVIKNLKQVQQDFENYLNKIKTDNVTCKFFQ